MKSRIVLGTVQFGMQYGINSQTRPLHNEVFEILDLALLNGITTLDTAPLYGEAETLLGKYESRNRFTINSKAHSANVVQSYNESVKSLQAKSLDTFFLHRFSDLNEQTLQQLTQLKSEEKINKIGMSVYTNDQFAQCIEEPAVDVIQFPFNLLDNRSKRIQNINAAKSKGKILQARSVFLQGLFFKALNELPAYLVPLQPYLEQVNEIARRNKLSVYELALRYALSVNEIDEVVIGVDNKEQLQLNFSIASSTVEDVILREIDEINVAEEELLYPYNWK